MSKFAGFQTVEFAKPKFSRFDLSHQKRLSTRMGRLTPGCIVECIPGDKFNGNSEILLRIAPLLSPIYDQIQLFMHYFFVPNRLLWDEWETFITGGRLGTGFDPLNAPIPPYINVGDLLSMEGNLNARSSLSDYLGVPLFTDVDPGGNYSNVTIDAMPFLAYQKVFQDYYRDRNFTTDERSNMFPFPSGEIDITTETWVAQLNTRAYLHDYFTSALPFTQRGVEVMMPLSGTGTVSYLATSQARSTGVGHPASGMIQVAPGTGPLDPIHDSQGDPISIENIDQVFLDASAVSINDFRAAYALQVWLERNAVAGSRYTESTQAHFGVKPQDSRLQRAEYIGGGRIMVKISEVVSTAYSDDGEATVPLANMAGHGITFGNTNKFNYFAPEHGFIIGIISIMNPPSYHQGLPRMFKRSSFLDYPWPTFAKLGEQQVNKFELFASANNLTDNGEGLYELFGYQSRYADWKHIHNTNHGEFHDRLLFWTLTRDFEDSPTLSQEFVNFEDEVQNRIFAVVGDPPLDNFWLYVHNRVSVRRALPYFGKPNTIGFS